MWTASIHRTKSWEEEEEEERRTALMMSGKLLSGEHVFLSIIYLMGEAGSTENTGRALERLREVQRQDWMLDCFPHSSCSRVVSYVFTAVW